LALLAALPGVLAAQQCPPQPATCEVSAPLYTFGRQELTSSSNPILSQGSISVTCTKTIQQGFRVNVGIDLTGIPPRLPRLLKSGQSDQLNYNLFLEPARNIAWGDGSNGTQPITDLMVLQGSTRVLTRTYSLYGRVDGGQQGGAGQYFDAIAARLRYTLSCG
jgi:spore coat protein U-like protein